jgi:hypothetical protein
VALGLLMETVHNLGLYQMILVREVAAAVAAATRPRVPFSVIVPVNRPWQHELNVARSPGLQEIDAEVICVQGASSAAAAYVSGSQRASHAWRVMAHQDVYFPTGSGYALAQQLGAVEQAGLIGAPIGFAGLEPDPARKGTVRKAGLVIDRTTLFRHQPSAGAVSMGLPRRRAASRRVSIISHWAGTVGHRPVPAGRAEAAAERADPDVLFHNPTNAHQLPPEFHSSARVLMDAPDLPAFRDAVRRTHRRTRPHCGPTAAPAGAAPALLGVDVVNDNGPTTVGRRCGNDGHGFQASSEHAQRLHSSTGTG